MLPPWLTPSRPKAPGEHAFDRDPDASEKRLHGELLYFLIVGAIVWLVVVAFFSLLLGSVVPAVIGVAALAAAYFGVKAAVGRFRRGR